MVVPNGGLRWCAEFFSQASFFYDSFCRGFLSAGVVFFGQVWVGLLVGLLGVRLVSLAGLAVGSGVVVLLVRFDRECGGKVTLDITVPLKQCKKLRRTALEDGFWVEFKYEYLPTFCFICSVIGHSERFCPKHFDTPAKMLIKPYGAWMRAQPRRRNNLVGSQWLRDGNETDEMFVGRFHGDRATDSVLLQQQPRREEGVGGFCGTSVLHKGGGEFYSI
ncbi:hypothetical protein F8388_011168 [Cannabis sativa]|uniref:Zinc knuckle CX2CX4HX4C domain-containing protein n=1 Tax=Cannabis sativa TaxID=3483 RepID=A0A7J6EI75_CANSA|nr:hypothetical protein F8388_011168 [Cannabis sativa]